MNNTKFVKFSPEQKKKVNEIIESRVKRERKAHAAELAEASQALAFWKHRAAFLGGQVSLLTEQNTRLTTMVNHPSNTQEKK